MPVEPFGDIDRDGGCINGPQNIHCCGSWGPAFRPLSAPSLHMVVLSTLSGQPCGLAIEDMRCTSRATPGCSPLDCLLDAHLWHLAIHPLPTCSRLCQWLAHCRAVEVVGIWVENWTVWLWPVVAFTCGLLALAYGLETMELPPRIPFSMKDVVCEQFNLYPGFLKQHVPYEAGADSKPYCNMHVFQ